MEYLNAVVRACLEREELSECFSQLDWSVQEDREAYEGMEIDQARR